MKLSSGLCWSWSITLAAWPIRNPRPLYVSAFRKHLAPACRSGANRTIAAVSGSLYVLWLLQGFWRKRERSIWMTLLPIALITQIALGAINMVLLAPVWMQMTHLLVAETFWILLVLASTEQLLAIPH
jgi:cytochrome c oxidase assembly protein subunit 15